jgi:transcriptional regulator with XRE-family HTH domain
MRASDLLAEARRTAGMNQDDLARRAGTSRPTLSAYEHGRKSPTLETSARLLAEAGFELDIRPRVEFVEQITPQGRTVTVPTRLPRLPTHQAFAVVVLPLHLNWYTPGRRFNLYDRVQRSRVYETVLHECGPADVLEYVDGALLIDLWPELVLQAQSVRPGLEWSRVRSQRPRDPRSSRSDRVPDRGSAIVLQLARKCWFPACRRCCPGGTTAHHTGTKDLDFFTGPGRGNVSAAWAAELRGTEP